MPRRKPAKIWSWFVVGLVAGGILGGLSGAAYFKSGLVRKVCDHFGKALVRMMPVVRMPGYGKFMEDFTQPVEVKSGRKFGPRGQLTFELFRGGTFQIDGNGTAVQKSDSYRDSAIIRSTQSLPGRYKISAVIGEIDYGLDKIKGLEQDPEYDEGPLNENGCYLLAIVDEPPRGPHTNDWWHQHRKVAIDVDNNVWGYGSTHPVFMIYFDDSNNLVSWDAGVDQWRKDWTQAINYDPQKWYRFEIEKTKKHYILSAYSEEGKLLSRGQVERKKVWHDDYPEYLVIGEPHENYYQGSMKIRSITLESR